LQAQAQAAVTLADQGTAVTTPPTEAAFDTAYVLFRDRLQTENRRFATISNVMKTKWDAANNSINNVR
jgi:hypothetical protein